MGRHPGATGTRHGMCRSRPAANTAMAEPQAGPITGTYALLVPDKTKGMIGHLFWRAPAPTGGLAQGVAASGMASLPEVLTSSEFPAQWGPAIRWPGNLVQHRISGGAGNQRSLRKTLGPRHGIRRRNHNSALYPLRCHCGIAGRGGLPPRMPGMGPSRNWRARLPVDPGRTGCPATSLGSSPRGDVGDPKPPQAPHGGRLRAAHPRRPMRAFSTCACWLGVWASAGRRVRMDSLRCRGSHARQPPASPTIHHICAPSRIQKGLPTDGNWDDVRLTGMWMQIIIIKWVTCRKQMHWI